MPEPAGAVAAHAVDEAHDTAVAATVPNFTVVDPVTKPVPPMVTAVPPVSGPAFGLRDVTVGTA